MALFLLHIVLYGLLGAIVFQDFKYRAIHLFLVLGVFGTGIGIMYLDQGSWSLFLSPLLFVIVVIVLLWIYISVKNKKIVNPFLKSIGIGDILFFFAITPLFSLHNYMLFFITGMIITLIVSSLYKSKNQVHLIPLAGILSGYLFVLKLTAEITAKDIFYSTDLILHI